MIPFYSLTNWITALVVGAFAVIIFLGNKNLSTRLYAQVSLFVQLWAIGVGAYFFTESPSWVIFWNQYNHLIAGFIAAAYYIFSLSFPDDTRPPREVMMRIYVVQTLLFFVYFFTDLGIYDSKFEGLDRVDRFDLFKNVGILFYGTFSFYFALAFWNLSKKIRAGHPQSRALKFIFWGTAIGFIPSITADIALPLLGYYDIYWAGPPLALGWVAFILYAIGKHHIFSIRLLFAEVSVLVMSMVLFVNIFLTEDLAFGIAGRIFIFLAFAIVGAFFIRNIIEKEEQKEKLSILTKELSKANDRLEAEVAERTAELSEETHRSEETIENLTSGLIEYTSDFRIVRVNKKAEELLGISRQEVIGMKIKPKHLETRSLETLAQVTYPVLSANEVKPKETATGIDAAVNEISVTYPAARDLQIVTAAVPNERGEATGFVKLIRDITREKLAAKSKSEFITIAAHQLRTPLSAIKWNLGVMLAGDRGPLSASQATALSRADETNEKMITLVNDLLNVARIEDGRFGYNFQPHNIVDIIASVAEDIRIPAQTRGIEIRLPALGYALPPIYADRDKLSLAIRNLLDNALHYTPRGGAIEVKVEADEKLLHVEVSDTGIGIPETALPRLFTKFFRAENAKKTRTDGSGLGLFIVRNIIARHGGTITVKSKEHAGTTFHFSLPLEKDRIPEAEETTYY